MITIKDDRTPLPPCPATSMKTVPMAGILVDVYGLDELAARPAGRVACLWLHHARTRTKEHMRDFACRIVPAWDQRRRELSEKQELSSSEAGSDDDRKKLEAAADRGLIVLAFDQRNHGTRLVSQEANKAWREGNQMHATDLMAMIKGMVEDTRGLMDVVEGYLLSGDEGAKAPAEVDMHLVLGKSLGGHTSWQLMFREERVEAAVIIVGCPDYMYLMTDRARRTKLPTYDGDNPENFLGSRHFPRDLVKLCRQRDPKGILFGTGPIAFSAGAEKTPSEDEEEQTRLRRVLDSHNLRRKRFFLCAGSVDKLVPFHIAAPFLEFFERAVGEGGLYGDAGVEVQNRVYEGVGHTFSEGMQRDALAYLLGVLEEGPRNAWKEKSKM